MKEIEITTYVIGKYVCEIYFTDANIRNIREMIYFFNDDYLLQQLN